MNTNNSEVKESVCCINFKSLLISLLKIILIHYFYSKECEVSPYADGLIGHKMCKPTNSTEQIPFLSK